MATNGRIETGTANYSKFYFQWQLAGQDTGSNVTTINWQAGINLSGGAYWGSNSVRINNIYINGGLAQGSRTWGGISGNGDHELVSGSWSIGHNTNGDKNFGASISGWLYGNGNRDASGSWDLPKIPRYANFRSCYVVSKTINSVTVHWECDAPSGCEYSISGSGWAGMPNGWGAWGGTSTIYNLNANTNYNIRLRLQRQDSGLYTESGYMNFTTLNYATYSSLAHVNIGSNIPVSINNPSGVTITLDIKNTQENVTFVHRTMSSNSISITPTADEIDKLYAATPNSNTLTVRYIITTVQNDHTYTTKENKQMYVTNANPAFYNFDFKDTNATTVALTGNDKTIINGYSNMQAIITQANKAVAQKHAYMVKYVLNIGSKTTEVPYSNADVTTTINASPLASIKVRAVDSRGNYTEIVKSTTLVDFANLVIKNADIQRQEGISSTGNIIADGTYTNVNFGSVTNTIVKAEYRKKATTGTDYGAWTDITALFTKADGKFNNVATANAIGGFTFGTKYDVQLRVSDKLSLNIVNLSVNDGNIMLVKNKTKKLIGVGKIPDNSLPNNSIDVAGTIKSNGKEVATYIVLSEF